MTREEITELAIKKLAEDVFFSDELYSWSQDDQDELLQLVGWIRVTAPECDLVLAVREPGMALWADVLNQDVFLDLKGSISRVRMEFVSKGYQSEFLATALKVGTGFSEIELIGDTTIELEYRDN